MFCDDRHRHDRADCIGYGPRARGDDGQAALWAIGRARSWARKFPSSLHLPALNALGQSAAPPAPERDCFNLFQAPRARPDGQRLPVGATSESPMRVSKNVTRICSRCLPLVHAARWMAIAVVVDSIIQSGRLSLSAIGRATLGRARPKHNIKLPPKHRRGRAGATRGCWPPR